MIRISQIFSFVFLLCFALSPAGPAVGQTYDYFNQWYRFDQNYIKLQVPEDGMYRVTLADLQAAGVDVSGLLPENLQVIYRGREQKIRVVSNGNVLDYFEFYGRENDGHLDSLMYRSPLGPFGYDPTQQGNSHSSLFNDTSAYFVTWDSVGVQRSLEIQPNNYAAHTPEPWYRYRVLFEYTTFRFIGGGGSTNANHVLNPDYITGEGFTGPEINENSNRDAAANVLPTPGFANSGAPSKFVARYVHTNTANPHILGIEVKEVLQYTDTTSGIQIGTREFDMTLPLSDQTRVRYYALAQGSLSDFGRPIWHYIEYDRNFDLDGSGETTIRQWARGDTTYLRFFNADVTSEAWLFDPANNQTVRATVSGDTLHFLLPGYAGERTLYVYTDNALQTPQIQPRTDLVNLSSTSNGADFVIITHPSFASSAQAYKRYRDTSSVNGLDTRVVYVDEIFDEFGYGTMTPQAIKNFCKYTLDNWSPAPRYFMLWGKGRPAPKQDNVANFVPVWGDPVNDYEFVSNFGRGTPNIDPLAGIGRVNIYTDADGFIYLDKVKQYENLPYEAWRKETVFLGGGKTSSEQSQIRAAMENQFIPFVEGAPMGGKAWYYQRLNTGNVSNTEETAEEQINNGVGLIHFFGHSGTNIFDVDILEAKVYQNYDRVPFMIAFGCYGGEFTRQSTSFGERFIMEPERGSIGYLANSTAGFLTPLRSFGEDLYENMFANHYNEPIGDVIRATIAQYALQGNYQSNILTTNHAKQMNLQGDPTIVLRFPAQPDLRITETDLFFTPENLSALDNQYDLNLIVHNDGRMFSDSFQMSVRHRTPSGALLDYPSRNYPPITLEDTVIFPINNQLGPELAGLNQFEVMVDALDSLDEHYETNNFLVRDEVIQGNIPAVLFPYDFAIIDSARVRLAASTWIITREANVPYAFEIDTSHTFNSPFRRGSGTINGSSAYAEWDPGIDLVPGEVYFWRVRLANVYPVQWNTASFKYVPGETGWSQSHPAQFFRDPMSRMEMDEVNLEWHFSDLAYQLHCFITNNGGATYFFGPYFSDNEPPLGGLYYVSFDHRTLEPNSLDGQYGDWNFVVAHDPAANTSTSTALLFQAIADTKQDDYFLIASYLDPKLDLWEPQWYDVLKQIGVDPSQLADYVPGQSKVIIFGRKGAALGSATVITSPNLPLGDNPPRYDLLIDIGANYDSARVASPAIGPTNSWARFEKDWRSLDAFNQENFQTTIQGVRTDNSEVELRTDLNAGQHGLASVDANEFPYLRLEGTAKDNVNYTAPQLEEWEVYYVPAPDAAIDPTVAFSIPDTISEGQIVTTRIGMRNVSRYDLDSMLVRVSLQRADRSSEVVAQGRFAPLPEGATGTAELRFHTASLNIAGDVTLIVELNPDSDQIEQHQFNNFYFHRMFIETDQVGPILDVTVDGKRLIDGDIVSPEPEITIQINDENEYLPVSISDTTYRIWFGNERNYQLNGQVFIEDNNQIEEVSIGRLPKNKAELIFRPGRLGDGEYTLAVQAFDFKGNSSGNDPYIIHFNVVNEKAISKVLPYPNPFSTSTRFVYTLTGDEKPYVFEIYIYTISGRLVKTIDLLELEDVNFGYNITEYAWDGRDEYGDALANGVYIYKAKVKFRDRFGVGDRDEGIDEFFSKNGYGKVYLMR